MGDVDVRNIQCYDAERPMTRKMLGEINDVNTPIGSSMDRRRRSVKDWEREVYGGYLHGPKCKKCGGEMTCGAFDQVGTTWMDGRCINRQIVNNRQREERRRRNSCCSKLINKIKWWGGVKKTRKRRKRKSRKVKRKRRKINKRSNRKKSYKKRFKK